LSLLDAVAISVTRLSLAHALFDVLFATIYYAVDTSPRARQRYAPPH